MDRREFLRGSAAVVAVAPLAAVMARRQADYPAIEFIPTHRNTGSHGIWFFEREVRVIRFSALQGPASWELQT